MRSPGELSSAFRSAGVEVTPQRQLLFRLLHTNHTHPSADALFAAVSAKMPGISSRTVYQTLNDLMAMGELQPLTLGGDSTCFDPNTDDHHHVMCVSCGEVRDMYLSGGDCLQPDEAIGFDATRTSVVSHGHCERCGT